MSNPIDHYIPEVFLECLERGAVLEENDFETSGELICDRCEMDVPVAAFNYYGPPSDPAMETIGDCCFEENEGASNIIITWKAGPQEANYNLDSFLYRASTESSSAATSP